MPVSLVACEVVWAELAAAFPSEAGLKSAMDTLQVSFSPIDLRAALAAGEAWREYWVRGGRRDRLIADFLIRGHALHQADQLLARDRGFARTYLTELVILDPSAT